MTPIGRHSVTLVYSLASTSRERLLASGVSHVGMACLVANSVSFVAVSAKGDSDGFR